MNRFIQRPHSCQLPTQASWPHPAEVVRASTVLGLNFELVTHIPRSSHDSQLILLLAFSLSAFPSLGLTPLIIFLAVALAFSVYLDQNEWIDLFSVLS